MVSGQLGSGRDGMADYKRHEEALEVMDHGHYLDCAAGFTGVCIWQILSRTTLFFFFLIV